jgi:diguanylate cyclase (GGDEF)-like protein/PAS domain S-box-containing protein
LGIFGILNAEPDSAKESIIEIVIPSMYLLAGIMVYATVHHFAIAINSPRDLKQMVFAGMCLLAVPLAIFHAITLDSSNIIEFVWALKWSISSMLLFMIFFLWFVALFTGKLLKPLLGALSALFAVLFMVNLTLPNSLQYDQIDRLHSLRLPWNELITRADGHNGYWAYITIAVVIVTFGYTFYAIVDKYTRSRRFVDLSMLCAVGLFLLGSSLGILVRLSIINFVEPGPIDILAMVIVMSAAITHDTRQKVINSERRFRSLVEQAPFSIQVLAPDGYTRLVNPAWEKLWGMKLEEIADYNILRDKQLVDKGAMPYIEKGFAGNASEISPIMYNPADNPVAPGPPRDRWVQSHIYPIKDETGTIVDVILMHQDVTEHKLMEDSLRESETRFRTIIEQSPIGMSFSRDGYTVDVNPAFLKMFGYSDVAELRGSPVINRIAPQSRAEVEDRIRRRVQGEPTEVTYETFGLRKDGSQFPLYISAQRVMLNDGPMSSAFLIDFTERKAAEEKINHLAFYDSLTGLPNRRLLIDRLQHALVSGARRGRQGALLFIDLDNFKTINNSLGHFTGDLLLQQVARQLASCVREDDSVARFGGDEFVVILEDLNENALVAAAQTETIGEKILAAINQPYQLAAHEYHCTTSIGATLFDNNQQTADELLKQADIAMFQAKKTGRNTLCFFDQQMQDIINARTVLEGELHTALENQQFQLYYQIQVDNSGHPIGAEALIRWVHPERGLVFPAQFIPLAEETGLILPIGQWVLDKVCAQIKAWQQSALTCNLVLSANMNAKQFRMADFSAQVRSAVQRYTIDPKLLKLELTESMLLEDVDATIAIMMVMKEMGIQLSLDDFGTGYSSLQYLKRLPLDQLKIDQSFIHDIAVDSNDKAIVRTIIAMAQGLSLGVIAEGVETEEQRQFLLDSGCTHYQGYLFGRPVPIDQFEALLTLHK